MSVVFEPTVIVLVIAVPFLGVLWWAGRGAGERRRYHQRIIEILEDDTLTEQERSALLDQHWQSKAF